MLDRLRVNRGYKIQLEPDKYPDHSILAKRLRRKPGMWEETAPSQATPRELPQQINDEKVSDIILPHQAKVIDEIRRNRELLSTPTEQKS